MFSRRTQNAKTASGTTESVREMRRAYQTGVKRVKKHHHLAVHLILLVAVVATILVAGRPQEASTPQPSLGLGGDAPVAIDQVSSADVAAEIALGANLIVADNVNNLADTLTAQADFSPASNSTVAKPYIVHTERRRDIQKYTTKEGDTVSDLAQKFNITSDTIRWANNITGEALGAGRELIIPPVSGILHNVQAGDTADSLAQKYRSSREQIIAFNDAEVAGLPPVGTQIIIPNGLKPEPVVRRSSFSSSGGYGFAFGAEPLYGGNGYSYGYCTWHAANRRAEIGKPIPRNFGNAITWASLASRAGMRTSGTPRTGSVVWHNNIGGFGHVAFVEKVNEDGSALVSDMNYPIWNKVTYRTISPSEFRNYVFID